jgi:hypothetical protein
MSKIGGEYVYCIQRGYTFRTKVSELQMVTMGVGSTDTIASHLRDILANKNEETGVIETFFRCWGQAEYNDDNTNLIPTTSDYAPTSYAWQEAFDEDGEDTEDPDYESKYEGDSTRTTSYFSIWKKLTGHEESLDTYQTEMKEIKYSEAGLDESQYYAFGITQYILCLSKNKLAFKEKMERNIFHSFFSLEANFIYKARYSYLYI